MEVLDTRDIPVRNQHHRSPPSPGDFPQSEHVPLFKNHRDVEHEDEPLLLIMTPCHQRLYVKFRIHPGERALETITLQQRSPPRSCSFFMMGVVMLLDRASIATTRLDCDRLGRLEIPLFPPGYGGYNIHFFHLAGYGTDKAGG